MAHVPLKRPLHISSGKAWRCDVLSIAAPMLLYVVLYALSRFIPMTMRPTVYVETLHNWEMALFGSLSHQWFDGWQSVMADLLAATPYTLHFVVPVIFVVLFWRTYRRQLQWFAWTFAVMNIAALITQILFPTAPPWYYEHYGLAEASYAMLGDPAGLARVDTLFHTTYFANMYAQSSVVFGAFPSMHAAWPLLLVLCSWRVARRWAYGFAGYTLWVWWAALYLHHHYLVDVLGGAVYAVLAFLVVTSLTPYGYESRRCGLSDDAIRSVR